MHQGLIENTISSTPSFHCSEGYDHKLDCLGLLNLIPSELIHARRKTTCVHMLAESSFPTGQQILTPVIQNGSPYNFLSTSALRMIEKTFRSKGSPHRNPIVSTIWTSPYRRDRTSALTQDVRSDNIEMRAP